MNSYLRDLINRMHDNSYPKGEEKIEGLHESSETGFTSVYDEARSLRDSKFVPELMELIAGEKEEATRDSAYFVLSRVVKNVRDLEGKQFLVASLTREVDTNMLVTILHGLADIYKPSAISLQPIIELTEYNSRIRSAAYRALTNSEEPMEDFLLDRLQTAPKDDYRSLINALMYVGTSKSLPAIMKHINSRNGWVYDSTRGAITVIMLREGYDSAEIERKIEMPTEWVDPLRDRLSLLTHPDRNS